MTEAERIVMDACIRALHVTGAVEVQVLQELDGPGADALVRLRGDWGQQDRIVEVKARITPAALPAIRSQLRALERPLLFTRYVHRALAEELRDHGIEFADAAGNAFLRADGLHLWAVGAKRPPPPLRKPRLFQYAGLKILFVFLKDPDAVNATYRDICRRADAALGNVGWILRDLHEKGYVQRVGRRRRELVNRDELLERWEIGYAETLRPKLYMGRFAGPGPLEDLVDMAGRGPDVLVGGELGAARVTGVTRPTTATLHTRLTARETARALKLVPAADGPTTMVRQFGTENAGPGHGLADPLLLRAELLVQGDDRLLEMADALKRLRT